MKRKPQKKHWYRLHYGECPVCGRDKSYRERVYGKRPRNLRRRIEYLDEKSCYDHCIDL